MKFIALIGLNGSGKSTTANKIKQIIEDQGYTVRIESFATPLKVIASKYCGYEEKYKFSQRPLLESLARTMKDEFGEGVFAYALLDRLDTERHCDYVIIDDLRYPEELELIGDFFYTYLFQLPSPGELADGHDSNRLFILNEFIKREEYPLIQINDLSDETLMELFRNIDLSKFD
jgi:energy-coupling factor transporter ATP-binding protein EcfA2